MHHACKGPVGLAVWGQGKEVDRSATVRILLESKARLDAGDEKGRSPLHLAIESRDPHCVAVVRALIRAKADVTAPDQTPRRSSALHEAAKAGSPATREMLAIMLQSGSCIDDQGKLLPLVDGEGRRPLHWASELGDLEAIKLFVEAGEEVNAEDHRGQTPVLLCKAAREPEGVAYLQSHTGRTLASLAMFEKAQASPEAHG